MSQANRGHRTALNRPSWLATMAITTGLAVGASGQTPVPMGYVRINQLGYETGRAARAYLVTTASDAGAVFEVRDGVGQAVFTAPVGLPVGKWGSFVVTPLNFSVATRGTYSITVNGNLAAASGNFTVAGPGALYYRALGNSLSFYQNQRDGADFIPSALRAAPGHLSDASAAVYATPPLTRGDLVVGSLAPTGETIDSSGGWWDAGDYMKYVETTSYTVAMMLTGLRDFPRQMGPGGPADFTAEAKFGLTWLRKMWNDRTSTLYYETGISQDFRGKPILSDYDIWRLPQVDATIGGSDPNYIYIHHRPVFAAGPAGSPISPNLAGKLSAAFALGFIDYRATDPPFAQQCLRAAEQIYDLADTNPGALLTVLPYDGYPETEWRDDLEWGATELNLALALGANTLPPGLPHTSASYYLTQAAHWARAYIDGPNDAAETFDLYDVSALAHFDLHRAITLAGGPSGLAVSRADLLGDLSKQLTNATAQAATDPFGFGVSWATSDTAANGLGLSVAANEYASLGGGAVWDDAARRWMGNVLGANIWGVSFIVGDGTTFPHCLHHQVANLAGSLAGGGVVLNGAVVEGPNAINAVAYGGQTGMLACTSGGGDPYKVFTGNGARFWDSPQNYVNTEPAIDLTATSPLAFAWRVAHRPKPLAEGQP